MIRQILNTSDIDAACTNAQASGPVLIKNTGNYKNLSDAVVLTNALSGWCAEREAYHANIRSRIASRNQIPDGAVYERDIEKYWYYVAGQRQLASYNALNKWVASKYYSKNKSAALRANPSQFVCPDLKTKDDEMVYFVGLLAGTQAVANNLRSGSRLPVPQDMLTSIQEKVQCLNDNNVWHGASALSNSLKVIRADEQEQKKIYHEMRSFIKDHPTTTVEFPLALYTYTAWAMGDQEQIDNALMLYNDRLTSRKIRITPYRLLNAMALDMVDNVYEMDRLSLLSTVGNAPSRSSSPASTGSSSATPVSYAYKAPASYGSKAKKSSGSKSKKAGKTSRK